MTPRQTRAIETLAWARAKASPQHFLTPLAFAYFVQDVARFRIRLVDDTTAEWNAWAWLEDELDRLIDENERELR